MLRVPGVGDVSARADNFSMRVWMNPDKMASYGLMPTGCDRAHSMHRMCRWQRVLRVRLPGKFQTHEISILVNGRMNKVSEFENVVVKTIPSTGEMVYLKDIARVELGKFTFSGNSFVDGKRCFLSAWFISRREAMRWRRPIMFMLNWSS